MVETSRSGYKVEESVTVFWEGWEGEKSQIDRETFSILLGWLKLANDVAAGKHQTPCKLRTDTSILYHAHLFFSDCGNHASTSPCT